MAKIVQAKTLLTAYTLLLLHSVSVNCQCSTDDSDKIAKTYVDLVNIHFQTTVSNVEERFNDAHQKILQSFDSSTALTLINNVEPTITNLKHDQCNRLVRLRYGVQKLKTKLLVSKCAEKAEKVLSVLLAKLVEIPKKLQTVETKLEIHLENCAIQNEACLEIQNCSELQTSQLIENVDYKINKTLILNIDLLIFAQNTCLETAVKRVHAIKQVVEKDILKCSLARDSEQWPSSSQSSQSSILSGSDECREKSNKPYKPHNAIERGNSKASNKSDESNKYDYGYTEPQKNCGLYSHCDGSIDYNDSITPPDSIQSDLARDFETGDTLHYTYKSETSVENVNSEGSAENSNLSESNTSRRAISADVISQEFSRSKELYTFNDLENLSETTKFLDFAAMELDAITLKIEPDSSTQSTIFEDTPESTEDYNTYDSAEPELSNI